MTWVYTILFTGSLAVLFMLWPIRARADNMNNEVTNNVIDVPAVPFERLFKHAAKKYAIPWQLLAGIAYVESSYRANAVNSMDNESIGLMQILCRPDGLGGCTNTFPAVLGWNSISREKLFNPEINVDIAAQILSWNIQNYGVKRGIAIYNSWDQRFAPTEGPFKNQNYVNKVLIKAKELGYVSV